MLEQQIQDFVHRATVDAGFRGELQRDARCAVSRLGLSPKVEGIALRLTPELVGGALPSEVDRRWWD